MLEDSVINYIAYIFTSFKKMSVLTSSQRVTLTFYLGFSFSSIKDFPECRSNANKPMCIGFGYMQNIDSGRYCAPPGNALLGNVTFITL